MLRGKRVQQTRRSDRRAPRVVYTPESQLGHPLQLFKQMWQDLLASRELAMQLLVRNISAQYCQSFLGIFWAFVPPIVTAIGFTFASNAKIVNIETTDLPYPAYVIFSMTLWQTFVEALNGPSQVVAASKQMLARINFPREALILAKLGEVFFNFAIKLILIVALFLWYRIPISWTVILAPVALIHLIILGTFFCLVLASLGVLCNDIAKGLTLIIGFWLFLTPIVYPVRSGGGIGNTCATKSSYTLVSDNAGIGDNGCGVQPVWILGGKSGCHGRFTAGMARISSSDAVCS